MLFHRFITHVPDLVHYWAFWYITNINQLIYIFNIYTPLSRPLAPVLAEIGIAWIGLPLTLPNVISQYLFFFFSFYIFLFVSLSTIYFYCRTTETPKHLQMMLISEKTIISPLYYYEYLYKNILIGEFHIDNEIIEVKDRTGYFIGSMY